MALTTLTSTTLSGVKTNGLIREDVMNKIWDISKIPLPFSDMIGSTTSKSAYKEWTTDELQGVDTANSLLDGADADGDDTATGKRMGNHHQISDKVVKVSHRADAVDTIGRTKELAYQVMRRQQELRRDVEAIALLNQASRADNGTLTGNVGGLPSWLVTNTDIPGDATIGGFDKAAGGTTVTTALTRGTKRALSEATIKDVVQSAYENGGNPTKMMSTPAVIRAFSEHLFTSSARVASLMSDQGRSAEAATALGSVNVFVTDFGTLTMVPNRLQQAVSGAADVFILDPEYLELSYLEGYRTDDIAKNGLSNTKQMSVDWTLVVNTEKAHGMISDIDTALAATA